VSCREVEHGQALGNGFLGPLGKFWMLPTPGIECGFQEPFGLRQVGGVEDGAQLGGHRLFGFLAGDEVACVLLQMELTALPGHGGEYGPAGRLGSGMIIGNDQRDALQASGEELFQKRRQLISASEVVTSQPSIRRLPEASMPTAIRTAQSTMQPSWRTFS